MNFVYHVNQNKNVKNANISRMKMNAMSVLKLEKLYKMDNAIKFVEMDY